MLKRILLSLLCFSGWKAASCLDRQYHYVDSPMTWTEAQTYCRQKHTDLALIRSSEEMEKLLSSVSSDKASSVWIGLYSNIEWKWSDGYKGNGADYRNWKSAETNSEPNFYGSGQFCGQMHANGGWYDDDCVNELPFLCYRGTQQDPEFVFVSQKMDWSSAQRYCRENYIDLATVRNDAENQRTWRVITTTDWVWIGLHRDPNMFWSDGSAVTFTNWEKDFNPLGNMRVVCGTADLQRSGKWRLVSCELKNPFVCYTQGTRQQVIKLRMKVEDSSVDLNDPAVKADILKKLQDTLKETGSSGLTLKWREKPDGKVFHKQEESPQMKKREKTEF